MQAWRVMLGPFLIWAAHFVAVYGVASVADIGEPGQADLWRTSGLILSAACLVALLWLSVNARLRRGQSEWVRYLSLGGCVISGFAVLFQSLPLFVAA